MLIQVYNDANILEKIMKGKRRDLVPTPDDDDMTSPKLKISMLLTIQFVLNNSDPVYGCHSSLVVSHYHFIPKMLIYTHTPSVNTGKSGITPKSKYLTPLQQKLNEQYEAVKNFTDKRGRRLSTIFLRLPSRAELPNYYIAIKKPVDMEKVRSHMLANKYQDVDALVEDLVLMFNNACTYNEPESLIYRDALVLHRVLLETRRDLEGGEDAHVPDVARLIQELVHSLFVSVLGHQDDEGRCYSDSLAEIPATDPSSPYRPPLNFEIIRTNVDRGRYKRLDLF